MTGEYLNTYGYMENGTDNLLMPHVLTDTNSVGYGGGVESLTENSYPFENPSTLKGSTPMATVNAQSYYKNNGGGGGAMTQKVMFQSRPEFNGVENPVSFEQAVAKLFSDFPVVLASNFDAENKCIAFSFNNNSIKDDCLTYFRAVYSNSGPEGETVLEALETVLNALEPNIIYTSENIPVIDVQFDDADEILTLEGLSGLLYYGMDFGVTPFTIAVLEGFKMNNPPFNTEGSIFTGMPVYTYNTATEQLSLYYEAFSQM